MLERIRLPLLGERADFHEEQAAWNEMMLAFGITHELRNVETHDKECDCGMAECKRVLAMRRYVKAHIIARRARYARARLQESLDEYVTEENAHEIDLAHGSAIREEETRQFKQESQDESR